MSRRAFLGTCVWVVLCMRPSATCVKAHPGSAVAGTADYSPLTAPREPTSVPPSTGQTAHSSAVVSGSFLDEFPPNFDSSVWALHESEGTLFVGGEFFAGGAGKANCITRFDGLSWHNLQNGIFFWHTRPAVYCLATFNGSVYAGGQFVSIGYIVANHISRWDGSRWREVATGVGGVFEPEVYTMTVLDGYLYVGGEFTAAGGVQALGIARWDGNSWSAVGSGVNARVYATTVHNGELYAGGAFFRAGVIDVPHIARWDGASWSPVGQEVDGIVYALAIHEGSLHAGGAFVQADGAVVNHVMRWDGTSWTPMNDGVDGEVHALRGHGSSLFVGGNFLSAGGTVVSHVTRWDGSAFHTLGSGTDFPVLTFGTYEGDLVAGGWFTRAGGHGASRLARWDGLDWRPLSDGFNDSVHDFTTNADTLYAAGRFSTVVGTGANRVARWDAVRGWRALGDGVSGPVAPTGDRDLAIAQAVTVHRGDVWVGGSFERAGGIPSPNLARWDGSAWSPGATNINGIVADLLGFGDDLYAGGTFTSIDGTSALRIARWDGVSWQPAGTGVNGAVHVLGLFDGSLFVGGAFTAAGGVPSYGLARWNGLAWSAVITTPASTLVSALTLHKKNLIVGGTFTTINGVAANNVAEWDGGTWAPLGVGLNTGVQAFATYHEKLYAGGDFTSSGPTTILWAASWDGTEWSSLGQGMDPEHGTGTVHALATHAGTLFLGGDFGAADDVPSGFIARWETENPNPVTFLTYSARWNEGRAEIAWESHAGDYLDFQLSRRNHGDSSFRALDVPISRKGSFYLAADDSALPTESYEYRVVASSTGAEVASFEVSMTGRSPQLALHQNAPNPFREATAIRFDLPGETDVELSVYDVTGRKMVTLLAKRMPGGLHAVTVAAEKLPAGVYFYRLRAGKRSVTRKCVVLK